MTEPEGVTYRRCPSCQAAEFPGWPMTHRRNCPDANTDPTDWSAE